MKGVPEFFSFKGRATRLEFWLTFLSILIIIAGVGVLANGIFDCGDANVIGVLVALGVLFEPLCAVTTRRLHDTGRSGVWGVVSYSLMIGWCFALWAVLMFEFSWLEKVGLDFDTTISCVLFIGALVGCYALYVFALLSFKGDSVQNKYGPSRRTNPIAGAAEKPN